MCSGVLFGVMVNSSKCRSVAAADADSARGLGVRRRTRDWLAGVASRLASMKASTPHVVTAAARRSTSGLGGQVFQ